ncbi:hypothetical protein MMC20_007397 [Loxospora ochrophaea]|nr:hypothetical protein [Loxospora ochrophaea]
MATIASMPTGGMKLIDAAEGSDPLMTDIVWLANVGPHPRHDVKVLLLRKEWKKFGQLSLVKLLPRLVSNGFGNGEVDAGLDAVISDVAAVEEATLDGEIITVGAVDEVAWEDGGLREEDGADEDEGESNGSPFPLGCRGIRCGSGLGSSRISPPRSSLASVERTMKMERSAGTMEGDVQRRDRG